MNIFNLALTDNKIDSTAAVDESLGIIQYGKGNAFPAKLLDQIQYSSVSNRCIDKISRFIGGQGFEDESLNSVVINDSGDTMLDLLRAHAMDMAYFEGIYTHIQYNLQGLPAAYNHLPFEITRIGNIDSRGVIDNIKSNIKWGSVSGALDNEYIIVYDYFNPDKAQVLESIKLNKENGNDFEGQVLYSHVKRPQKQIYPAPQYYSAINWIGVDAKIGRFHYNNLDKNFLLSCIIEMVGDPDEPEMKMGKNEAGEVVPVPTGRTKGEAVNADLDARFSGSESGGMAMVIWSQDGNNSPKIQAFPSNTNEKLFTSLQTITTENLLIGFDVQPILANVQTSGKLGNTQEITNAFSFMNANTKPQRMQIEQHYAKLFKDSPNSELSGKDFTIKPLKYEGEADQAVGDEIDENAKAQANLRGSVGGVQGLLSIQQSVSQELTDRSSAVAILQEIYGFDELTANALLGAPKIEGNENANQS